jgi:hypothetical protein
MSNELTFGEELDGKPISETIVVSRKILRKVS